ncbi:hypothetical protein CDAR_489201 [Caerostris darwini]|uniref:TIL domain-containing protein n=1 Tax=Caerostris darwini TaxID=1538125 RepID=A0AAV4T0K3_9ARAC|nr:hypothetical protein CDAR_489201 [Caerostris darwini]
MASYKIILLPCLLLISLLQCSSGQFCDFDNEMFVECVNPCNVCENPGIFCTQNYECLPGCDCLPGFSRDKSGRCVESTSCGASVTPINPQVQPSHFGDRDVIVEESAGRCNRRVCTLFCRVLRLRFDKCVKGRCTCKK